MTHLRSDVYRGTFIRCVYIYVYTHANKPPKARSGFAIFLYFYCQRPLCLGFRIYTRAVSSWRREMRLFFVSAAHYFILPIYVCVRIYMLLFLYFYFPRPLRSTAETFLAELGRREFWDAMRKRTIIRPSSSNEISRSVSSDRRFVGSWRDRLDVCPRFFRAVRHGVIGRNVSPRTPGAETCARPAARDPSAA